MDLADLLKENGSKERNLYGFNIYFDGFIDMDSNIIPLRNRNLVYSKRKNIGRS